MHRRIPLIALLAALGLAGTAYAATTAEARRHIAVSFGMTFDYIQLSDAMRATDEALNEKADQQAA